MKEEENRMEKQAQPEAQSHGRERLVAETYKFLNGNKSECGEV